MSHFINNICLIANILTKNRFFFQPIAPEKMTDTLQKYVQMHYHESECVYFQLSLKFIPRGPVDSNKSLWADVLTYDETNTTLLPEPVMI